MHTTIVSAFCCTEGGGTAIAVGPWCKGSGVAGGTNANAVSKCAALGGHLAYIKSSSDQTAFETAAASSVSH